MKFYQKIKKLNFKNFPKTYFLFFDMRLEF